MSLKRHCTLGKVLRAPFSQPHMDWLQVKTGTVEPHFKPDAASPAASGVGEEAQPLREGFTAVEVVGDQITMRCRLSSV